MPPVAAESTWCAAKVLLWFSHYGNVLHLRWKLKVSMLFLAFFTKHLIMIWLKVRETFRDVISLVMSHRFSQRYCSLSRGI